jgi:CTP synthase
VEKLEAFGIVFSGKNKNRMEIAEIPDKRFFFASQFHPEFKSRPGRPSPPFNGLVRAMCKYNKEKEAQ